MRGRSTRSPDELALDRRLDLAARMAAAVVASSDRPTYTLARFLIMFGDKLQDRPAVLDEATPQPARRSA